MPKHQGLYFQQWDHCARCGFTFPLGQLMTQKGLLLDSKCMDNLDVELRPAVIAEILSDTQETSNEKEDVYSDPNELIF